MNNTVAYDILIHYGVGHLDGGHSGRYQWGSGDNPYQRGGDFLNRIDEMKKEGKSEKEIAEFFGLSTTQLRTQKSLARAERRSAEVAAVKRLAEDGYSPTEIARRLGYANESSVRNLLNANTEARMNVARATADIIKKNIDEKGLIDIGEGVERELGVSREKLEQALTMLQMEGYEVVGGRVEQATNPGKFTTIKAIGPPGTEKKEVYDYDKINSMKDYISTDGGDTFGPAFRYPESMDSKRLKIRYADELAPDGSRGIDKDGLIEIRPGAADLDLNGAHYSQVRILVDGTHYIKGMAAYGDPEEFPKGVDVIFNTNKSDETPALGPKGNTVLKPISKDNPENPFGSLIKDIDRGGQYQYTDENGEKHWSLINKRSDEGDWEDWDKKLPAQFLAKQNQKLIDQQLKLTIADKKAEYDEICALTNPTVKKAMLDSFADDCDSAAVHLKAAALPREKYQVIIPVSSLKDNECYAPNYKDGETLALVRFPHGGTFEIPIVKVNNKNAEGKKRITPNAEDAIGINSKVAERLSGADFDGDTVLAIPCNSPDSKVKITSTPALFSGFDPKMEYGGKPEGTFKKMRNTQNEMGQISNLITDMTLKGCTNDELARAVKHSMVVIDAEKHGLDYKQSEKDFRIKELKKKYQGHYTEDGKYSEGAATLISRAKAQASVPKRRGQPTINPDGSLSYKTAYDKDLYYVDKKGKTQMRTEKSTQMAETSDAFTLSSGKPQETAYANFANTMKSLANSARKERMATGNLKYSPEAKVKYKEEVDALNKRLALAEANAPRERQAQYKTASQFKAIKDSNPDLKKSEQKKIKNQLLTKNRVKYGAKRNPIYFTDKEWEAIQSGAITENILSRMIRFADTDTLKSLATPRDSKSKTLSTAKKAKIKAMYNSGYTNAEIAEALGVSTSTISDTLNGKTN